MDVDCQQREGEHSYREPAPFREQCEHGVDFKVAACVVSRGFPGGYVFDLWCICCVCAGGYHFYKGWFTCFFMSPICTKLAYWARESV